MTLVYDFFSQIIMRIIAVVIGRLVISASIDLNNSILFDYYCKSGYG